MAFTCATGKHRRQGRVTRTTTNAMGLAALTTTGVIGTLTSPAFAADGSAEAEQTGLTQALSVGDAVAEHIKAQATAQERAMERKQAAEAARRQAAAEAKKEREAEEHAAREAERKLLNTCVAPISGSYVSTAYRSGGTLWSSGTHTGIDFHAASGTPVHAVGAGTVVEAGWGGAYGYQIVLRMHDGTYTQYGHLSSIGVNVGQSVTPGEQIALSGATGNVTGPHLHFEVRTSADYGSDIDPVAYLRTHGVHL
ncbi:M23 family metallopeptidase [Streptomyces sp. NPDC052051]|uniref:M23 family metallopeptidase n=1 Tax=Streptomyces sp. NPDC052051 TaxID=3154649 RepID=UPI0034493B0D